MLQQISYHFELENGASHHFDISTTGWDESQTNESLDLPEWTQLAVNRCANCPLHPKDHQYCPAAVDLSGVAVKFASIKSFTRAKVTVVVGRRTYSSNCDMNTGVRSIFGLCMALSNCPVARRMRPLALRHLPFATIEETFSRVVSAYLLKQHFVARRGGVPDWELEGLRELYGSLEEVNTSLLARIKLASQKDSNLNAMCDFVSFAHLYTNALDEILEGERDELLNGL